MQIIQLFRRSPPVKAQRGLRHVPRKRLPMLKPTDGVDEIFAKLAAVPWIRKTPVEL